MSDQLSSLLEAVEKNRNFAALSTYSISQLTKAAKNKVIENLEASTVVISVLEAHSDNLKMLEIVSECIKQMTFTLTFATHDVYQRQRARGKKL